MLVKMNDDNSRMDKQHGKRVPKGLATRWNSKNDSNKDRKQKYT